MRLVATLFFLCFTQIVFSQSTTIQGTVSDQTTGEPLIQAAIIYGADGSNEGVLTDFDGFFQIKLTPGKYVLRVSYVGYEPMTKDVDIKLGESVEINFKMNTVLLREAEVVTDIAIERETPVAFSNIKPLQIQEELGSQPIPMILNSTPGVYATQAGSDEGPSISIRGFKQRNVSVLVDGIPVNDMETGGVYWNNWFGLDLVTQTMQVQRGLGASKLALPAIGGSVNIITQGIENKKKTSIKQEVGSFGMTRTTIGHTSGRLDGDWGFTLAGSYKHSGGFVDQTYSNSWFYYFKVQKEIENHVFSLSATGAPSENSARRYKQHIGTYSPEYAQSLFNGTDEEYANMLAYSNAYHQIFNNPLILPDSANAAYAELNSQFGYDEENGIEEFYEEMSQTNFIDTTDLQDLGLGYNIHWGEVNDQVLYERQNKYHKPLISLRHSNRVSDRFFISNNLYASFGRGGGTGLVPSLGSGDEHEDTRQINFQYFNDVNTGGGLFPPINQDYSDSLLFSSIILGKSFNNHYWYGALSTFRFEKTDSLVFSGGIDLRTYHGEHYKTVHDLIGGDYYIQTSDPNDSEPMHFVGDTIDYHNDSYVNWAGAFGLVEYKGHRYNCFLNLSTVLQSYRRVDYFLPKVENEETGELEYAESGRKTIPGYTIKLGGNYNLNEFADIYLNTGLLNRTPVFSNVIGYDNVIEEEILNEIINSAEIGAKWSKHPFTCNFNAYYTDWNNRPIRNQLSFENEEGINVRTNLRSISALHKGVEFDFGYSINRSITLEGFASYGDWKWTSSDSLELIVDETLQPYLDENGEQVYVPFNASGVSVGDAPQTQVGFALKYYKNGFYVKPRYTFFDRFYSDFDPFSLFGENEGRESWELPSYGLVDLHLGYTMDYNDSKIDFRLSAFNLLNKVYIMSGQNNGALADWYFRDPNRQYAFTENNFDAASASVYMGYGFRTNFSVRVRF